MLVATKIWCALALTAISAECFRVLQATGYRPQRGYFKVCLTPYYALLVCCQAAAAALDALWSLGCYASAGIFTLVAVVVNAVPRKAPLRLTKRLWRMLAAELGLLLALCLLVNACWWLWLLPAIVLAAYALCLPLDLCLNRRYLRLAQSKLRLSGVKVIAVTGSYGKTSVKDMLSALLTGSISPEGSCNTPLGIAAFVNRTELDGAKYLVLEFGARKRGDIAELCRLFSPSCGIVTGVCAQHLATFKTLHNVIAAKRELPESLPASGFCVLNGSDELLRGFVSCGACAKYFSSDGLDIAVESVDFGGTTLVVGAGGASGRLTLPQIADYTADVLAMCVQTALRLGQSLEETLANASRVQPTPHRLCLMKGNGFYILDDSYNASLAGVEACCKTLKKFECPRVVITQGLAECGKLSREMNLRCGSMLGEVCDTAVVLGKNRKALAQGLAQAGCRALVAKNMRQAVGFAAPLARGGILLFQNDLPDVAAL